LAGVDLTREQITARLPATVFAFDLTETGLIVWTAADPAHDVAYELTGGPELRPRSLHGVLPAGTPMLDVRTLLFSRSPLAWADWVHAWEGEPDVAARPTRYSLSNEELGDPRG
jgi:hypothetical protein